MSEITTHNGIAHAMVKTLTDYGIEPRQVFTEAGLDFTSLQSDGRQQARNMQQVWRLATQYTGDDAFGITFAKNMNPMILHGLGFSWMASDSLLDAFMRLVKYYRLITTAGGIELTEVEGEYRVRYLIPVQGSPAPASLDAALAVFLQFCRFTKGADLNPTRVELQRSKPENQETFNQYFHCPIEYGNEYNSLFFTKASLEEHLPTANPELARANDQVVIDYLRRFDQEDIVSKVRAIIIEFLPSGSPSQDKVASEVHVSARTLQRKLLDKGTSYKALLEEIRQELARQYLKEKGRSIGEVTYLLGFSEPSNFTRSFKRWTGMTPAEFQTQ